MSFAATEQGIFALISNLCGIICRMVYAPIEEISHLVFVQKLSKLESQQGMKSIYSFIWIIGLTVAVYLQVYSQLIMDILYGEN